MSCINCGREFWPVAPITSENVENTRKAGTHRHNATVKAGVRAQ